ncbi:MAG: hypothetical protein Q9215_004890 [Flavoplaca cf. flavocitrina]
MPKQVMHSGDELDPDTTHWNHSPSIPLLSSRPFYDIFTSPGQKRLPIEAPASFRHLTASDMAALWMERQLPLPLNADSLGGGLVRIRRGRGSSWKNDHDSERYLAAIWMSAFRKKVTCTRGVLQERSSSLSASMGRLILTMDN